ncbi:DNA-binding transcriptional regulator, AcrR family [Thermomonospora echinospora]|uniref:DNA-binding transcriptional regulator, AcrR family n=1 Tax=Thermomonospora echinospora TaxID=1992 RepID=A0A1H6DH70_9ACTN|nr:TetR/AcrR family transcriptional regulator [Thermomonospora echinospora]SEG84728.1 DNA-binding transcriptional regulator, AcrR family [Thermomonospora echinospora]
MGSDTRARLLETAAQLFREQGYAATGLKQITAGAGAPWGSLYHFFPGGKEQLGIETINHAGARYLRLFDLVYERTEANADEAVRDIFQLSAEALEKSGWADGCPIATVALEAASTSEPLRHACAEVFAGWRAATARRFAAEGIEPAEDLAIYVLAAFEGALILSRTSHDTRPLRVTADIVAHTIRRRRLKGGIP